MYVNVHTLLIIEFADNLFIYLVSLCIYVHVYIYMYMYVCICTYTYIHVLIMFILFSFLIFSQVNQIFSLHWQKTDKGIKK